MSPARTWLVVLWACGALAAPVAPAAGQALKLEQRLVHLFDFEEADDGNFEDLPIHWFAMGREALTVDPNFMRQPLHQELTRVVGYPRFTLVRFNKPQQEAGNHSLHLKLDGGNAGAFLAVGALAAIPGSDYLVTARVRTEELDAATAVVTAYLVDRHGRRLDASVVSSGAVRTAGAWQDVMLRISGDYEGGAWLGMQVELRQPQPPPDSPLGRHQVVYQQVKGQAWFDDIAVWQLPSVRLGTQSRTNVIRWPQTPRLDLLVRDLSGQPLVAQATVYDHALKPVAKTMRRIGDGAPGAWAWEPALPGLGWYLVDLTVAHEPRASHEPVARSVHAFLWLREDTAMNADDAPRFGIDAQDIPEDEMALVAPLLDACRLSTVTLSVWDRRTDRQSLGDRQRVLDDVLQALLRRGQHVRLSLYPLPQDLGQALNIDVLDPLTLLAMEPTHWVPLVSPNMMRHGQRVHDWQLGRPITAGAFHVRQVDSLVNSVVHEFENLAPQPRVALPWRLDQERRAELGDGPLFVMHVPAGVLPEHIGAHLAQWQAPLRADVLLNFQSPSAADVPHESRVDGLARRMVHAWESGAAGLEVTRPWASITQKEKVLVPDPLLGVFASVSHRLAGRRALTRMPLGPGMQCVVFDGPTGGMLVAWNDTAPQSRAVVDMFLGVNPVVVDVWGNRHTPPTRSGRHVVPLGSTPVFIEGIDTQLALFRASFRVEPGFVESTQAPHHHTVTIANPWPRTISGHMTLTEPGHWRMSPKRQFFSVAAGQSTTLPLSLTFPISEVTGHRTLTARFDFTATQQYSVDVSAPLELGLADVEFDASLTTSRDAQSGKVQAMVTVLVTNTGREPRSLYAFAQTVGYPRQERLISQLKPGQSIVRRFQFDDAQSLMVDRQVRVGLRESNGPAVLNQVLRWE